MSTESLDEQLYWTQQQVTCTVVFIVLSVFFVTLKLVATILQQCDKMKVTAKTSVALTVAGIGSFIPFCVLTIRKYMSIKACTTC